MVVVTQAESATALVRWAASLTVLCCLLGEPIIPLEPVTAKHPEGTEELLRVAAEAISEIQDMEVPLFVMRYLAPVKAIINVVQDREIELLCVGMDFTLPKDTTINRLGRRLLRFAPCKMFRKIGLHGDAI